MKLWIVLLIVLVVAAIIFAILTILGKRAQKKQDESFAQMEAAKQVVNMLIIDKKRMPMKDANLPPMVMENVNFMQKRAKIYVVKGKVGPKIATFLCDKDVYEVLPIRKEVKATVAGLYIMSVKGIRGSLVSKTDTKKKKEGKLDKLLKKGRGEL